MNVRVRFPLFPLLFHFHLFELSYRVFYFFLSFFLTSVIIYSHKSSFFNLFCHFASDLNFHFIYTFLSEAIISIFIFSIYLTFLYLLPLIFYHIYQYLNPGLYTHESNKLYKFFNFFIGILFFSEFIFYFLFLPNILKLFLFTNNFNLLLFTPKISEYISFLIYLSFGSFLFFLLPCIFLIGLLKFSSRIFHSFSSSRGIFYFFICCILSLITPAEMGIYVTISIITIITFELWILIYCIIYKLYNN